MKAKLLGKLYSIILFSKCKNYHLIFPTTFYYNKTMFSDTHFHFKMMTTERGESCANGPEVLTQMAKNNCFFGLDIGTDADDLLVRQSCIEKAIASMEDQNAADKARKFIYFSAGIWPNVEDIHKRQEKVELLKQNILAAQNDTETDTLNRKIIAIGECGLDHHWNPSGADGRCESDFDQQTYDGEKELFKMQIQLAKEMNLPVIVHSRDAFEDTLECIKEVGYHNGIIHCYSYGFEEAKAFLDLGWYISLSGSVTYTKKNKMEEMEKMIQSIPNHRLLCETDAPYLAPVPMRGKTNTPILVEHTYNFVAACKKMPVEELSNLVDKNIKDLFKI